ncbi:MAG TPA: hypothetical protein PKK06_14240 [Phycisphaerae bacterium]|nr:hypothetical protein [Phycisphaerae bacterium]HNU46334.1 hypothetical protein [Phycisphaerae bacterium]
MNEMDEFVVCLRQREWGLRLKVAGMAALGIPLSLLAPAVAASVLWPGFRFAAVYSAGLSWLNWVVLFELAALAFLPLLYCVEIHRDRRANEKARQEADPYAQVENALLPAPAREPARFGGVTANPRPAASFMDAFLWGPRLVVAAVRRGQSAWYLRRADRVRAAEVLRVLLAEPAGVDTTSRFCREEDLPVWLPTLAYLTFYRWVGMRDAWEHIWLFSESRTLLAACNGGPARTACGQSRPGGETGGARRRSTHHAARNTA